MAVAWQFIKTHKWILAKNVACFGIYGTVYCWSNNKLNHVDADKTVLLEAAISERLKGSSELWNRKCSVKEFIKSRWSDEVMLQKVAVCNRYSYLMAGLHIVPIIACVAASRSVAKARNILWSPLLSRALDGGTQMGMAAALSYFIAREITSREHLALPLTGMRVGFIYAGLIGNTGTLSLQYIKRGGFAGLGVFCAIQFCGWLGDISTYMRREDLTHEEWDQFPVVQHLNQRILKWCNLEDWIDYWKAKHTRELVMEIRDNMDELEYLLYQARIDPSDCEYVNWVELNDEMFYLLGELRTGRHQFDRIQRRETTTYQTLMGNFLDPS